MKRVGFVALVALVTCLAGAAAAQSAPPAGELKFEIDALDRGADPCADFHQYACGNWLAHNPVPADRSLWSRYNQMANLNQQRLTAILQQAAQPRPGRSPEEQKIGDYYASCMDDAGIEAQGLDPLRPELARIAAVKSRAQLVEEIAHLNSLGVNVPFDLYPDQDMRDSSRTIAFVDQGGLGMRDPERYTDAGAEAVALRQKYLEHLKREFVLLGDSPGDAGSAAQAVLRLETALAQASWTRLQRRDREKQYHLLTLAQLTALTPGFSWKEYFAGIGLARVQVVNVSVPGFLEGFNALLGSTPLEDWKNYLRWHLVQVATPALPAAFVSEGFDFEDKALRGLTQMPSRAERCQSQVDRDLGEAEGKLYVEAYFPESSRQGVLRLVGLLKLALKQDIQTLPWMTAATRQQALAKLDTIGVKIGHPETWRDYSSVRIARGDALGNALRSLSFEFHRQLAMIGKPVDRGQFYELPQSIEGYHDNPLNEVVFTAGILQPPFFDPRMDDAVNFGICGGVIGHELTHAFDDQGRKWDGQGNLRDWWTPEDASQYQQRASCFAQEYSQFTAVDDLKVDGQLTLGENIADNGGLHLAYLALTADLAGKDPAEIDGFTPQQRFFLAWGQIRCANVTEARARSLARTDPHSPGRWRVNGVVSNMPEFAQAFHCPATAPMVRKDACRIW
ncbi:MAG TPA: M13 family metallopeptidase [Terriglobales bacterium]|nr:M13 family metallopeptidase [Terriglobales bacterium]